jgi:alpha-L-arabinofuranosidase
MKHYQLASCVFVGICLLINTRGLPAAEPDARISVQADKPGANISPLLYGIFFEEINRAGEGGIYAEMLQNRSFEDGLGALGWTLLKTSSDNASMSLDTTRPLNPSNRTSLKLAITKAGGRIGVSNEGFKGAPYDNGGVPRRNAERFYDASKRQRCGLFVEKGKEYRFSMYIRGEDNAGPVSVTIEKQDGTKLAEKSFDSIGGDWKKLEAMLTATNTDTNARLVISTSKPATLYFDMVSLMPVDTFKGHATRKDLTQMIADMHPSFIRFPGGCYVEGDQLRDAFRWKKSIGDVAERPGHYNLWGYYSSDGLGYHEYLQLCEDIGAEPLFVINCGMSHSKDPVPMDKMDEYVQDALDAIEYANGPADSKWGSLRAKAGHPEPFHLRLMEIGNENGGPIYNERYALFYDAIKKKYPEIKLVVPLWQGMPRNRPIDLLDEHYYDSPEYFFAHTHQYDSYDRNKYKVYVGEYAVTSGCGRGNLIAAVAEAAFMTGMERNGDVVHMSSYAPLFVHPAWRTWNPNAIVFDSSRSYGTPSYWVQAMFAANRADRAVGVSIDAAAEESRRGMVGVGTWKTQAEFKDIRVEHDGKTLFASDFSKDMSGWKKAGGDWQVRDGALRQTGNGEGVKALAGDPQWSDYTLTLKARKVSGNEGFLILFNNQNTDEKYWWNLGGWGNSRHNLEGSGLAESAVPGHIETGRWYDIKIEVHGKHVTCSLDGKVIHRVTREPVPLLASTAGWSAGAPAQQGRDELILKVVNGGRKPMDTKVSLQGVPDVKPTAQMFSLTGGGPNEENSFANPHNIPVLEQVITGIAPEFRHTFPAYSVTIFRLKAK